MKQWIKRKGTKALDIVARISPMRGVVFLLGYGLLAWGLFMGNPIVDTFDHAGFYTYMAWIADEGMWGALFIFAGLTTIAGTVRRDIWLLRMGALAGFCLFSTVSILYALVDPAVTAVIVNTVLALLHGWVYIQALIRPENLAKNVKVIALDDVPVDQPPYYRNR